MNCIPGSGFPSCPAIRPRLRIAGGLVLLIVATLTASCSAPASEISLAAADGSLSYQIHYRVTPEPLLGGAQVELRLVQSRRLLREFDMQMRAIDPMSIAGDGDVRIAGDRLLWQPPAGGGALRWFVPIDHRRDEEEFDAHINPDWALFRADDIMPAARTRTLKGATSETHLSFDLPRGWSSVTQYFGRDDDYAIDNPGRRFDRPTGWILLGDIGTRNEDIAGMRVVVAGPIGHAVRRMDILALLQWTLPELAAMLPDVPRRLTVISAGAPMWRGGLSAPASIFVHAERPLLSENATSTLLHEVVHVGFGLKAGADGDWIVEGLAEYYGLELLRRSGTISPRRHAAALQQLETWGREVENLCQPRAHGPVTARAVVVLDALDRELRRESGQDLDELVRRLRTSGTDITVATLQTAANELAGRVPGALARGNLPGCSG